MNRPDAVRLARRHDGDEPVFAEPWHAQVVAVVDLLMAEGRIDANVWSQMLGAELRRRAADGAEDCDETYYLAFLDVLERALNESRSVLPDEVDKRERDWRDAYLSTPHGKPVVLKELP